MIVERIKHSFGETGPQLRDKRTKVKYSRVYGGYCHPGSNPGSAVVVAEHWDKDKLTGKRPYRVLAEVSESNPSNLVRAAAALARSCCVEIWFADNLDRPAMELLRLQPYRLRLTAAPFLEEENAFETYLLMIRELTQPTTKLLNFGGSAIPGVLATIRSTDVAQSSKVLSERFPAVAALGFAVAGLETRSFNPGEDEEVNLLTGMYCLSGER